MDTSTTQQQNLTDDTGLISVNTLIVAGFGNVAIELAGTFIGTVQFEGTVDNTTWAALTLHPSDDPSTDETSATAPGIWLGDCGGLYAVRARCSAYTSGLIDSTVSAATPITALGVSVDAAGGLSGDGTDGSPLEIAADGVTTVVNGSNLLTAIGLVNDWTVTNGKALRTDTTTAHTAKIQAYDVDGAAYTTFVTLTNGNTPSCLISQPSGATLAFIPPTADPHVVGALWNNAGTLTISAG